MIDSFVGAVRRDFARYLLVEREIRRVHFHVCLGLAAFGTDHHGLRLVEYRRRIACRTDPIRLVMFHCRLFLGSGV